MTPPPPPLVERALAVGRDCGELFVAALFDAALREPEALLRARPLLDEALRLRGLVCLPLR
jgi:hypothetical protein